MTEILTIEKVLIHYGANLNKVKERDPHVWQKINCPFHGDEHASASVLLESAGAFSCHACDIYGDPVNVIARAEGFGTTDHPDRRKAIEWARHIFGKGIKPISQSVDKPGKQRSPHSSWRARLFD